ncbi:MAG: LysM peptidoglycan-binding domain-containing protein, partial [Pseudomonadota bacterium]
IARQSTSENKNYLIYKVRKGDNLTTLSRQYKMAPKKIADLNHLKRGRLYSGQMIKLTPTPQRFYVVRKGDSLEKIAKKFKLTVDGLIKVNDLASKTIMPRQKIRIPL